MFVGLSFVIFVEKFVKLIFIKKSKKYLNVIMKKKWYFDYLFWFFKLLMVFFEVLSFKEVKFIIKFNNYRL